MSLLSHRICGLSVRVFSREFLATNHDSQSIRAVLTFWFSPDQHCLGSNRWLKITRRVGHKIWCINKAFPCLLLPTRIGTMSDHDSAPSIGRFLMLSDKDLHLIFGNFDLSHAWLALVSPEFRKFYWEYVVPPAASRFVSKSKNVFLHLYDICTLNLNCRWSSTEAMPPKKLTHAIFVAFCKEFDYSKVKSLAAFVPTATQRPKDFANDFADLVESLHMVTVTAAFLHHDALRAGQIPQIPNPYAKENKGEILDLSAVLKGVPCDGFQFKLWDHHFASGPDEEVLCDILANSKSFSTFVTHIEFSKLLPAQDSRYTYKDGTKLMIHTEPAWPPLLHRNDLQKVLPVAVPPDSGLTALPNKKTGLTGIRSCKKCISKKKKTQKYRRCDGCKHLHHEREFPPDGPKNRCAGCLVDKTKNKRRFHAESAGALQLKLMRRGQYPASQHTGYVFLWCKSVY